MVREWDSTNYENMAKFTGTTNININTDLSINAYGGGNIAKTIELQILILIVEHTQNQYLRRKCRSSRRNFKCSNKWWNF